MFVDKSLIPWSTWSRKLLAAALAVVSFDQPMLAAASGAGTAHASREPHGGQEQVLHALNRLTFGPRPGEVEAVSRLGLERWFELQLSPSGIDDSALERRLDRYPAMRLSFEQLEQRYPSPQRLRQMENGLLPKPTDPALRTLVDDQIAFDQQRNAVQAESKAAAGASAMGADASNTDSNTKAGGKKSEPPVQRDPRAAAMQALEPDTAAGSAFASERKAHLLALPPEQRMQAILALSPVELVGLRRSLLPAQVAGLADGMRPDQRELLTALAGSGRMVALEAMETRALRDLYSERELEAVMTDFWLNHFNVYVRKNQNEPYLLPDYERTIRANALGNFETLLVATAKSPAMLEYLDNFNSIGPDSQAAERVKQVQQLRPNGKLAQAASAGLNENYGRELMELHTLGVGGGYTQADVTQVAKVFTGWTIARPYGGGGRADFGTESQGGFVFDERRHEPGAKTVLGHTIRPGGMEEGLEVLHLLATSPATAHFLSQQLAVRFVSDTPPAALVDRMAETFLSSHGDIKSVLRTMFHAPEFWSPAMLQAKVKTPEEFVFSAARASNLAVDDPLALVQSLDKLGMPLYGMQTPNGYSWKQDGWVGTGALVSRMNFALVMSGDRLPGAQTEWTSLLQGGASAAMSPIGYDSQQGSMTLQDSMAKEKRLELVLLGRAASEKTHAAVLGQAETPSLTEQAATQFDLRGQAGKKGGYRARGMEAGTASVPGDDAQAQVIAGLLLGSPEFQRR